MQIDSYEVERTFFGGVNVTLDEYFENKTRRDATRLRVGRVAASVQPRLKYRDTSLEFYLHSMHD